jgi:hypothetical protein
MKTIEKVRRCSMLALLLFFICSSFLSNKIEIDFSSLENIDDSIVIKKSKDESNNSYKKIRQYAWIRKEDKKKISLV